MRVNGLRRVFHWRRPKENPDTLPMVGASALGRSMALRHSERDCSGLLATFDLFNDDGAQKQRKTDAPRQKVEIHGGGLVTAFDFLNDDGADDKGDGKASRQKI